MCKLIYPELHTAIQCYQMPPTEALKIAGLRNNLRPALPHYVPQDVKKINHVPG